MYNPPFPKKPLLYKATETKCNSRTYEETFFKDKKTIDVIIHMMVTRIWPSLSIKIGRKLSQWK